MVIDSGKFAETDIDIEPLSRKKVMIKYNMPKVAKAGAEYFLNLKVTLKEDTLWAKAGHEIAYNQLQIPVEVAKVPAIDLTTMNGMTLDEDATIKICPYMK